MPIVIRIGNFLKPPVEYEAKHSRSGDTQETMITVKRAERTQYRRQGLGEMLSPIRTLLNTREARGETAIRQLRTAITTSQDNGELSDFVEFQLFEDEVALPPGWLMSKQAREEMKRQLGRAGNPCSETEVARLAADNTRVRYLLDEEGQRLLPLMTGPRAHARPAVLVAVGTGMRRGDQLSRRWEQVDFQRNVIRVPNAKTGHSYQVPMSAQVRQIMLELRRAAKGSDYVFANPVTGKPYTEPRRPFDSACREAGIKGLRRHDLRHRFGTRLDKAGHSEATIAELMGHTDPKTTRRYTHGTERAKRAAVEAASLRAAEGGEQRAELALVATK